MEELNTKMSLGDLLVYITRQKLRFPYRGQLNVESLWDLETAALNDIYITLREGRDLTCKTGLSQNADDKKLREIEYRMQAVRYIYDIKVTEQKAEEERAAKNQEKQRILGLIAEKQNEELRSMSLEELKAKLKELE